MRPERPSPEELGRRLKAARAYRGLKQIPVAEKLGVGPDTLGVYEKGQIPESRSSDLLDKAPSAFELPEAFFVIDFGELDQMADAWKHVRKLVRKGDIDVERLVNRALDEDSQCE